MYSEALVPRLALRLPKDKGIVGLSPKGDLETMTRDDDPTQPLPAAGDRAGQPATAATEPLVAPHVPVADVDTAEVAMSEPMGAAPPGSGARRVFIVGLSAVAAAVVAVLALSTLPRGDAPAPIDSSPPVAPSPTEQDETVDGGTDADPEPDPAPEPEPDPEPEPEPTVTPLPTVDPTPEPTP